MPYYRVRLKPKGPFFKGINSHARKSTAIVHSDVLHSAFLCVSATIDPYWLKEDRAISLLLSSIYPYYKNIYLYPKPFAPATDDNPDENEMDEGNESYTEGKLDRKRWKKTKYVSEGLFVKLLGDKKAGKEKYPYLDGDKGTTFCLDTELEEIKKTKEGLPSKKIVRENYKISTVIDRGNNQATPYPQNFYEVSSEEGVGLWFLVKLEEGEIDSFQTVLSILGELGIGGERSSGFGHFSVENIIPLESGYIRYLNDKDILVINGHENLDLNAVTTLSLYHPTKEEFEELFVIKSYSHGNSENISENRGMNFASYECAVRGGWIHSVAGGSEPKMSVRMCIEGSIFPAKGRMPQGDVIDISYNNGTSHAIWRSGLAFNIYFHHQQNEEKQQ